MLATIALLNSAYASAEEIILRLRPEPDAPIITRITATEKVVLDAAPAGENNDWRQLDLKVPFDAYVPTATLTKNFAIVEDTPVHFLPDTGSATITRAKDGDFYEIKSVKDEWATVRFKKALTTYFQPGSAESTAPKPREAEPFTRSISAPTHTPEPNAADFDPNIGVGKTLPDDLPPENVLWKSASREPASIRATQTEAAQAKPIPPKLSQGIMVSPNQTQAREKETENAPPMDEPLRLLVGTLVRKIDSADPGYPVRLLSDEGRLIAYVDFSGIFIEDLSPYLNERVYLRGHLSPVQPNSRKLVLFVRKIQIAE